MDRTDAFNLTGDVVPVVTVHEANTLYLGADFDDRGRAFDLELFHYRYGVPIAQHIAERIADTLRLRITDWRWHGCKQSPPAARQMRSWPPDRIIDSAALKN